MFERILSSCHFLAYSSTTVFKMCKKKENFTSSCPYKNKHPDIITKEYLNAQEEEEEADNEEGEGIVKMQPYTIYKTKNLILL